MAVDFVICHNHSYHSTLDGLSSPTAIARRLVKTGGDAVALTDHNSVSGGPSFMKALADACGICGQPKASHRDGKGKCMVRGEKCGEYQKANLKGLIGCEFNTPMFDASIRDATNRSYAHLCVLAKNMQGWKNLLGAVSESNKPENYYYKPRLHVEKLAEFASNQWIAFSGHVGSQLANFIFDDYKSAYRARNYEEAKSFVKDWNKLKVDIVALANHYQDLFGKGNFFIEIQLLDAENIPAAQVIVNILRWVSKQTGIPCIATPDAHYASREDAPDQRILLCAALNTTLRKVADKAANGEDVTLGGFFKSNNYFMPGLSDMVGLHTKEELHNTVLISDMIEPVKLLGQPRLPKFECPDGLTEPEYVRKLCQNGWNQLIENEVPKEKHQEYKDRLATELEIFDDTTILHSYFLIMSDICRYSVEKLGSPLSEGRGSASGTLIGYLMRIHDSDPIEGGLIFSRFFNHSRSRPDAASFSEIPFDSFGV